MDLTPLLNLTPVQVIVIWIAVALFAIVANAMPAPTPNSGVAYRWLYGALHAVGANLGSVLAALKPKLPPAPKP